MWNNSGANPAQPVNQNLLGIYGSSVIRITEVYEKTWAERLASGIHTAYQEFMAIQSQRQQAFERMTAE